MLGPDFRKILRKKYDDNLTIFFVRNEMILTQTYDNMNFRKILKQSYKQS